MRKILAVIVSKQGHRVVVGAAELKHCQVKHFEKFSVQQLLEMLELALKDPDAVFMDKYSKVREHHIYYRLETGWYVCVIVKLGEDNAFFASMYSTGKTMRNSHKR